MSVSHNLGELVALVEQGQFLEAFDRFYADDAIVQENDQAPRVGLSALIENEKMVLATFARVVGCARRTFVDGDQAVIHWHFEFDAASGSTIALDELALQTWEGGKIVREKFYYDPIQMRPAKLS